MNVSIKSQAAVLIILLLINLQSATLVSAQVTITVRWLRYLHEGDFYVLELSVASPDSIGSLEITVWNESGVVLDRIVTTQIQASHIVEFSASQFIDDQELRIEITGFAPDGSLISDGQNDAILATHEFTHQPEESSIRIQESFFQFVPEDQNLVVSFPSTHSQPTTSYQVILENKETNVVELNYLLDGYGMPPLIVPVAGLENGEYNILIHVLARDGLQVAIIEDSISLLWPIPVMSTPRFEYDHDQGILYVGLELENISQIDHLELLLVNEATNEVFYSQDVDPSEAPPIAIDLEAIPPGDFLVVVDAINSNGQTLASVENESIYSPLKPSFFSGVWDGLRRYPLLYFVILLIIIAIASWIVIRTYIEKRATSTPILQTSGLPSNRPDKLPLNQTLSDNGTSNSLEIPAGVLPPKINLVILDFPDQGRVGEIVLVSSYPFTIGRGDCNLDLGADGKISRQHARLQFDERGVSLTDLLSRNGTFVDGERIATELPYSIDLGRSTEIALGRNTRLILERAR